VISDSGNIRKETRNGSFMNLGIMCQKDTPDKLVKKANDSCSDEVDLKTSI
jgi:hypothetical protein